MELQSINYDFIAPRQIAFGWGRRREIGALGRALGSRALVISGLPESVATVVVGELQAHLTAAGVSTVVFDTLLHEPETADVDRIAAQVRAMSVSAGDFVIGVGGGAAIDLAKAVAAMATNTESDTVKDYLENVGRDLKLHRDPLPVMAVPTTAGTGAEATRNAVISSYDPPFKKSLRDPRLMPQIALVDPELTVSCPPEVTAASGMDAITQLIESYISRKAQPIPQALALQGLRMAVPAIVEAVEHGASQPAREAMSHAAMLSGLALANSGLGFAHGVAPALGIHCRVPHGVACALMLSEALRVNRQVREAQLARLAHLLYRQSPTQAPAQAVDYLIEQIDTLCQRVGVPRRLSDVGVGREQIPEVVRSSRGTSMSANPRDVSDEELTEILERIW